MDYIILDIEFNGRKFASDLPMEVIEIGAVRLNAELTVVDTFTALIKPLYFAKLNSFIKKKTGIPQAEIDSARRFPSVADDFMSWLGQSDERLFVTWGGEDMKRIVIDTRLHNRDDGFWLAADYYDLLKGYLRVHGLTNDVSVEAALTELGLAASGMAHRALDDALMTADIFRKLYDQLDLDNTQRYKDQFSNAKERRLVRSAVSVMLSRKLTPEWQWVVEHFLTGKVALENTRKMAELEAYFADEVAKKETPQRAPLP